MGFSLPITEVVGSNPASPISRYSGEDVLSEEVPEEWWGSWVGQFATESLQRCGYCGILHLSFFFLFVLQPTAERVVVLRVTPIPP